MILLTLSISIEWVGLVILLTFYTLFSMSVWLLVNILDKWLMCRFGDFLNTLDKHLVGWFRKCVAALKY